MNIIKKVFFGITLIFLGTIAFATDPKPTEETEVKPKSNPPECEIFECIKQIVVENGSSNPKNIKVCVGATDKIPSADEVANDVEPIFTDGKKKCEDGTQVDVSYDKSKYKWKFNKDLTTLVNTIGTHQIKLIGEAQEDPYPCDTPRNLEYGLNFIVYGLVLSGNDTILKCEQTSIFVKKGSGAYKFQSDNDGVAVVNSSGIVTGKGFGEANITVTDLVTKCTEVFIVKVKQCIVIKEPKIVNPRIINHGTHCVDNTNPNTVNAHPSVYYATFFEFKWETEKGRKKFCDGNEIKFADIDLDEEPHPKWIWTHTGGVVINEQPVNNLATPYLVLRGCQPTDTVTCLSFDQYHCTADEFDVVSDVASKDCGDVDGGSGLFGTHDSRESTGFAPSNSFAKIGLHGKPLNVERPQSSVEKDSVLKKFNIDAYHLNLNYSVVDISIPLQGSDLRLEMRRTHGMDTTNPAQGGNSDNIPNKIALGRSWRSNIAPIIYTQSSGPGRRPSGGLGPVVGPCTPPSFGGMPGLNSGTSSIIIVQDENGSNFNYNVETLEPEKKSFSDAESALHKLERTESGYLFTKKNGTVLEYEDVSLSVEGTNRTGRFIEFTIDVTDFSRLKKITDRNGNSLIYQYPQDVISTLPDRIVYEQHPSIYLDFDYNSNRTKLEGATDPLGRRVSYQYSNGNLSKVRMPEVPVYNLETGTEELLQPEVNYTYDSINFSSGKQEFSSTAHNLKSITDSEGNVISFTYSKQTLGGRNELLGGLLQGIGAGGGTGAGVLATSSVNDVKEEVVFLSSVNSPDGEATFSIDSFTMTDRITSVHDTSNNKWTYTFFVDETSPIVDENSVITKTSEKLLSGFTRSVEENGQFKVMRAKFVTDASRVTNLSEVIDYYGNITRYVYGVQPVTFFKNGIQVIEDYDFGKNNQPFQEIIDATPEGGVESEHLNITKEFGYESTFNQMVSLSDANGNVTTYDIDDSGNRIREIAPESKITTFTYNMGYLTSATDADGRRTFSKRFYHNDGWDDVTVVSLNYGESRLYEELNLDYLDYTPDNSDDLIVTIRKNDLVGNIIANIDGNSNQSDFYYDNSNQLIRALSPAVEDYDSEDQYTRPEVLFKRNKNRQVVAKRDARGNWTFSEYDSMNRATKVTVEVDEHNAENIIIETRYDEAGNKSETVDARGVRYEFFYDAFRNLVEERKDVDGLNYSCRYEYGQNSGNDFISGAKFVPTRKVDAKGLVTLLEYDNAYRLIKKYKGKANFETLTSELLYDPQGNLLESLVYNDKISGIKGDYSVTGQDLTSENQHIKYAYDRLNRRVSTVRDLNGDGADFNDEGDITTNTFYDIAGNVIIIVDGEGHSTQTEYDAANRVIKQVANLDDVPEFDLINNYQYSIVVADEDIVTIKKYDDNTNIIEQIVINDVEGSAGDQTIETVYDEHNRIISIKDPEGHITRTKYDLNGNVRSVINPRQFESISEYDAANRVIKNILPEVFNGELGINEQPEVLTFYDTNSNIIKSINTRGLVSINVFDNLNRPIERRKIIGEDDRASLETDDIVSFNVFDGNSNLIQNTFKRDDEDIITQTDYDAFNRPILTTDAEGFQSVTFYDLIGNRVQSFDKRANSLIIDGVEEPQDTPQLRYYTHFVFDQVNREIKRILPEILVAERSILGDLIEEAEKPFIERRYLKNGWLDETLDLEGNLTRYEYDNAGRKRKIISAIGQETDFVFDKVSNVLTQTVKNHLSSGGNQVSRFTYDKRNLLLTETLNPNKAAFERVYSYTYDENGNKKTRVFPNGDETVYNYDALDRLISEVYVGAEQENKTYQYSNTNSVTKATDISGTSSYEYDLLGRTIIENKFNTEEVLISRVESKYDKSNNRVRSYLPYDKKTLVSIFDKRNQLITMKGFHGKVLPSDEGNYEKPVEITTYIYNGNQTQISCTLSNGQTTEKYFDKSNRLSSVSTFAQVGTTYINIYSAVYKRDAEGNQLQTIETRTVGNGAGSQERILNYTYDNIYRLTAESDNITGEIVENAYIYDLLGNRISRIQKISGDNDQDSWIYTNDLLNRTKVVQIDLKGINNTSSYIYDYDNNGNRNLRTYRNNEGETSTHSYFYDKENRLTSVVDSETEVFNSTYDYRTRRVSKTEVSKSQEYETIAYLYDGSVTCQEFKVSSNEEFNGSNGDIQKQYIRSNTLGAGFGTIQYMERAADFNSVSEDVKSYYEDLGYGLLEDQLTTEYYVYNSVGSVVANTDQQGYVIRENDLDAYGNIVREEDHLTASFPIEFGGSQNDVYFAGNERDFSTGLDYLGFRYYDSILGKFISRDPSGCPDGPNNYLYVRNNPVNKIDLLGLREFDPNNPWSALGLNDRGMAAKAIKTLASNIYNNSVDNIAEAMYMISTSPERTHLSPSKTISGVQSAIESQEVNTSNVTKEFSKISPTATSGVISFYMWSWSFYSLGTAGSFRQLGKEMISETYGVPMTGPKRMPERPRSYDTPDSGAIRRVQEAMPTGPRIGIDWDDLDNFPGFSYSGARLTADQIQKQIAKLKQLKKKGLEPTQPYEVGDYKDLTDRSLPFDDLDLDHQPAKAQLLKYYEQLKGSPLTDAEKTAVINNGVSVAVPSNVHSAGPTYKGKNTQDLQNQDLQDMDAATRRDSESMIENSPANEQDAARRAASEVQFMQTFETPSGGSTP